MNISDLSRYGRQVPRYTSYPTAPHFSNAVDAGIYGEWLTQLDPARSVSLYLHVPYCREMCWYCGCYTKITKRDAPIRAYVDLLLAEMELVAARIGKPASVDFAHWGGGSPTILSPDDWHRTMERMRELFQVGSDAGIAVELDPRTTTREYVKALAACGVNRVSIGVQDFDTDVQQAINRIQPYDVTSRVVGWLRDAGITEINLDLMYGLPHQDMHRVQAMTTRALQLMPSRVALFGYAHVPWMRAHQRLIDENALPGPEQRWHQATIAAEILLDAGYQQIGLDHFALPDDPIAAIQRDGRLRRNFQGYTTDTAPALIGLGASSIGTLPHGYVQNVTSLRSYKAAVEAGHLATARGIALDDEDRLRRHVIERLMCDFTVDVGSLSQTHGFAVDHLDEAFVELSPMAADGIVDIDERTVTVDKHARPLVRAVAAAFDAYLRNGNGRHSAAV